ncbi:MAG: hypothetical protein LC777_01045 [Actinobacteria bacterium]|nr:hypothetical protein [Actinomycetota bacterium]
MTGGKILLLIGGGIGVLLAAGLLAAGGVSLWADTAKTDRDGYFSSGAQSVQTKTHALVSEGIDIDADADWVFDDGRHMTVRVAATADDGERLFLGVAPQSDVAAYLNDVSYDEVTDVDVDPFNLETKALAGQATPGAPGSQKIWEASVEGSGTQTLEWAPKPGDWSVVIMNADGSAGVNTQATFAARVSFLFELGLGLVLGGGALLAASAAMLFFGVRKHPAESRGAPAAEMAGSGR